jgi:hypothetical protein
LDITQLNLASLSTHGWRYTVLCYSCYRYAVLAASSTLADGEISVYIIGVDECDVTTELHVCYSCSLIL